MSGKTGIQWTDTTWNPTRGCSVVSPGCVNCYAMKQAHRFSGPGMTYEGLTKMTSQGAQWTGVVRAVDAKLEEPLHWRKPQRVFVDSMSDLFHEDVPDEYIDRVFATMALTPQHTYQILTKRPERMRAYLTDGDPIPGWMPGTRGRLFGLVVRSQQGETWREAHRTGDICGPGGLLRWPLPNVWLGVSTEDQERADERIPILLDTPAAVRFVSYEPALGPIDFRCIAPGAEGTFSFTDALMNDKPVDVHIFERHPSLNWIIVGGESGPKARAFDLAWARSTIAQCRSAGTAVFVKQLGARVLGDDNPPHGVKRWILSDGENTGEWWPPILGPRAHARPENAIGFVPSDSHGSNINEWPADLQIREFPEPRS